MTVVGADWPYSQPAKRSEKVTSSRLSRTAMSWWMLSQQGYRSKSNYYGRNAHDGEQTANFPLQSASRQNVPQHRPNIYAHLRTATHRNVSRQGRNSIQTQHAVKNAHRTACARGYVTPPLHCPRLTNAALVTTPTRADSLSFLYQSKWTRWHSVVVSAFNPFDRRTGQRVLTDMHRSAMPLLCILISIT